VGVGASQSVSQQSLMPNFIFFFFFFSFPVKMGQGLRGLNNTLPPEGGFPGAYLGTGLQPCPIARTGSAALSPRRGNVPDQSKHEGQVTLVTLHVLLSLWVAKGRNSLVSQTPTQRSRDPVGMTNLKRAYAAKLSIAYALAVAIA
jgi:hypothetical protein